MSCGRNQCYASCPPMMVTIQPPPFVLSIPGPSIYCPDQPFCIEQSNPCSGIPYLEASSSGGQRCFSGGLASGTTASSIYCHKSQQKSSSGSCRRF